jgi:hypothetical protein
MGDQEMLRVLWLVVPDPGVYPLRHTGQVSWD